MNLANQPLRAYSKADQLHKVRTSLSQRKLGEISAKVRNEVRQRSGGICEVLRRCKGDRAVQMAHITSRRQLNHRTAASDLLHSCVACHVWLDQTPDGIQYKRELVGGVSL